MISRVAKQPIPLQGVKLSLQEGVLSASFSNQTLSRPFPSQLDIVIEEQVARVVVKAGASCRTALAGTWRQLVHNMVHGLVHGFEKSMKIVGVGYKAQLQGRSLELHVGYNEPRVLPIPEQVKVEVLPNQLLKIRSADKELLGHFCALIQKQRSVHDDPYKLKGIRFVGEGAPRLIAKEVKKK